MAQENGRSARKIALLGGLYFAQGLPFGFQATALPVYLRERGVSTETIGFLGALSLPWMLKPLWAPLVDRWWSPALGRRRSWILPTQLGLAATCAAAAHVDPEAHLALMLALVFAMNVFAATQDIAVDGLAVDLLAGGELGPGNAAQVVGYKAGMLTSGGLLVWASARIGWPGLFAAMAALVGLVLVAVLVVREPPPTAAPGPRGAGPPPARLRDVLAALVAALATPGGAWLLAVVATYKLGESMIDAMFKPFLVDAGYGASRIGLWLGTWGMAASLLGSAAGGAIAARVRLERALFWAAALRTVPLAGEWALAAAGAPPPPLVVAVTIAEHAFGGVLTTVTFAFMMSRVDRRIGATHYTALAAIEVLGKAPAAWISGLLAARAGYAATFAVGVALSLGFLGLLGAGRRVR